MYDTQKNPFASTRKNPCLYHTQKKTLKNHLVWVGCLVGWLGGCGLVAWLVVGWLVGWLVGGWVGWLVGWLCVVLCCSVLVVCCSVLVVCCSVLVVCCSVLDVLFVLCVFCGVCSMVCVLWCALLLQWCWLLEDCAITRGNASSPIGWQALRRPQILIGVGQRSKATIDPRLEEYYLQDIHHSWKQFVFCIAVTGRAEKRGGKSTQGTGAICFKFVFEFSIWAKWRTRIQETGAIPWNPNKNERRDDSRNSGDRLRDFPECLEEFTVRTQFSGIRSGTSHQRGNEIREAQSLYSRPKDQNCEGCKRTNITRAPCRRRIGRVEPRAEKFGDLVTADHKVLNEGCDSRDNQRYAVVVQDLATQWIQSFPSETKTSHETEKSLQKFLEPSQKPKVFHTGNSLEFDKSCEDLSWNHRTSTLYRSETNGIAERAIRRVKDGTSAALLQSGLDDKWWSDSVECYCYLRNVQDLLEDGKTLYERRFGEPFKGPIIPFRVMVEYHPISPKRPSKNSSIWQEGITRHLSWLRASRGWYWERRYSDSRPGRFGKVGCIRHLSSKSQRERNTDQTKRWWIHIPSSRWYSKNSTKGLRIPRRRESTVRSEDLSGETQGESGESQPAEPLDDAEDRADCWSIQGDFISRHHNELVQLNVPKEERSPMPLKYIDVTRSTHTYLDVLQEKRIDDDWNVDANRSLSYSWKGLTKFTLLRDTSRGICVVWRETNKKSSNVFCGLKLGPAWENSSEEG